MARRQGTEPGEGRRRRGVDAIEDEHHEGVGVRDVDTVVETSEDVETEVSGTPFPGEQPTALVHAPQTQRDDRYLKSLFWLLIAATFFEGYDSSILALVLPEIQDTFGVTEGELGVSRGFIELGLFFAFFVARLGDRFGRRALLLWSVVGYTVFTALTAASWDLWSFTVFQSAARVFLGAEYAVAITIIVEEFPVHRRAGALGRLLMMAAAGALAVAILLMFGIDQGPLEWRTLYLVGVLPLLVLGWFRRRVKETRRFVEYRQAVEEGKEIARVSFWEPWRREFRANLLLVGVVHLLRSLPLFGSTAWFFFYAQREAGVERNLLLAMFVVAYGLGIGGYALCGYLMERVGRRATAVIYGVGSVVFPILLFQSRAPALVGILLVLGVFFGLGQAPLFGAMGTELFPTYVRNQTMAWSRNVFEIGGFILGPLLVGVLGDHYSGALGSIGDTVSFLFLLGIPGLWLVWRYLPETQGKELEEIETEVAGLGLEALEPGLVVESQEGAPVPATAGRLDPDVRRRRILLGVAAGLLVFAVGAAGLQASSEIVRRPEGAAERFLRGVSDEEEGTVAQYGSAAVAEALVAFEREDRGSDWFESMEVGQALEETGEPARAFVPFRVVLQDGDDTELYGVFVVTEEPVRGDPAPWRVVGYEGPLTIVAEREAEPPLAEALPSGGGPAPAQASAASWLLGLLAAVGLIAVLEGLLKLAGGVKRQAGQRRRTAG